MEYGLCHYGKFKITTTTNSNYIPYLLELDIAKYKIVSRRYQ